MRSSLGRFLHPPAFWNAPRGTMAMLLSPLAASYGSRVVARMEQRGAKAGVPVICIGNFTLGGAGKTPLALAVAGMLERGGETPFFLTRGYGGRETGPIEVRPADSAARVGDEPLLLAERARTILSADRVAGAAAAVQAGASVLVMDDGFQNPSLFKDCSILAVDGATGVGNGLAFPAGPLRAPLHAQMPHASAVVVIGPGDAGQRVAEFARESGRGVFRARIVPDGMGSSLKGKRVLAFAGIARPQKFFKTLADLGAVIAANDIFADHHPFTEQDAIRLATKAQAAKLVPVTTAKDMVRLSGGPARNALASMTKVVPVKLAIDDEEGLWRLIAHVLTTR